MAKLARRAAVALLIALVILLLLPRESPRATGAWLLRDGLQPKTARIGRFEVRYVRAGQGPPVILIHGLVSSIYTWAEVIPALAPGFDVIALDLPGFGGSSQPPDLSFSDYEGTVGGLMDELGLEKASLVGNSMGGAVALQMAARHPERVDHLVLIDSAGFRVQPEERPFLARLISSRVLGTVVERLPLRRLIARWTLSRLIHDQSRVTEERVEENLAPLLRPGALASARSLLESRIDQDVLGQLHAIEAPTLILWGRFDPWLPESDADRFVAEIKGARKVILEAGHVPQEERPDEVARWIGEFLKS